MRSTKDFIKDGVTLTATTLLLRTAGVMFSSRLAIIAGATVIGINTQIMSVYAFAVTAASAGVSLGTLRVSSECLGSGNSRDLRCALHQSLSYCIKTASLVALLLFFLSPFIGSFLLGDPRTVASLRILSIALPFISASSALHGYFQGVKKIQKSAAVTIFEQIVRISLTIFMLSVIDLSNTELVCIAIVSSNAIAESISFFSLYLLYIFDRKDLPLSNRNSLLLKERFIKITTPVALSAMIRSALTTAEHIIIPMGLKRYSGNAENALAEYGTLCGMAIPIVLYPMALLSAFASVTTAELSLRVSAGESDKKIKATISKGIAFSLIYGIGSAAVISFFSAELGLKLFKSTQAGLYLKILAPLVILMYLDHIADGMLKGLDMQKFIMKVNILDAFLSVILAAVLIPNIGILGFIIILYVCELLNCTLSIWKLVSICNFQIKLRQSIIIPTACIICAVGIFHAIRDLSKFSDLFSLTGNLFFSIIFVFLLYILILKITGCIKSILKTT